MVVTTYYLKLFRRGADRHNDILISLLLLVAETIIIQVYLLHFSSAKSSHIIAVFQNEDSKSVLKVVF